MKVSYSYFLAVILLAVSLSACQAADCEPEQLVVTSEVTVVVVVTATSEPVSVPDATEPPTPVPPTKEVGDWILPEDALAHAGENVSVRIEQAYCTYQASSNGTPTFCNDQPYPNHLFTFVIWGQDRSEYDGACVIVTGEIEAYDGKAEIVVEDEGQVQLCP